MTEKNHTFTPAQASAMREALDDLVSHREAWRDALLSKQTPFGSDDDGSYWAHELRAFDRTFAALAAQPPAAPVETEEANYDRAGSMPVAWIAFASNGNVRFWTSDEGRAKEEKARGLDMRSFTLAELVALVSKLPRSPCSAATERQPTGYAAYHPKLGWRLDLAEKSEQVAIAVVTCSIENAAQQGWTVKPLFADEPQEVAVWKPTDAQTRSACLSYRHDFGLMDATGQQTMQWQAREWLRAWQKEGAGADRNEIIERCAAVVDQANREGPYQAIAAASRIRALKTSSSMTRPERS